MRKQFLASIAFILAAVCGGCAGLTVHRVPPGQSLSVALAKRAIATEQSPQPVVLASLPEAPLPASVEPDLPASETEKLADLITTANLCLQTGQTQEAIAAYEEAVRLKPDFAEARYNLAVLYQQAGEEQKALEAFRKFKEIARH